MRFTPPPTTIADTLLRPTAEADRIAPPAHDMRRFEIRWNGPHWTEIDRLTGEIIAEGTIARAGDRARRRSV